MIPDEFVLIPKIPTNEFIERVQCFGVWKENEVRNLYADIVTEAGQSQPVAWLYTFQSPGKWTQYASVDPNERRDEITDVEWIGRKMTPLFARS